MNLFRDIKSPAVRAWNQLHHMHNMEQDTSEQEAKVYYANLSKPEQDNLATLSRYIGIMGEEFVSKEVSALNR